MSKRGMETRVERCGDDGTTLSVLFGGIHKSAPSLQRAGIVPGDQVYPVRVLKGQLFILGRLVAGEFTSLENYALEYLNLPARDVIGLHEFQLLEYIKGHCSSLGHRLPYGCSIEVLVGASGTPIHFNLIVPPSVLESLAFCSKKSHQKLKHIENGKLKSAVSLQGNVRRLCPKSAQAIDRRVDSA